MAHYTLIPNWPQSVQSVAKGQANAILPRRFVHQRNSVLSLQVSGSCWLVGRSQDWRYLYWEGLQHHGVSALTLPTVMSSLNDGCYFLRRLLTWEWWSSLSASLFSLPARPTEAAMMLKLGDFSLPGMYMSTYMACFMLYFPLFCIFVTS